MIKTSCENIMVEKYSGGFIVTMNTLNGEIYSHNHIFKNEFACEALAIKIAHAKKVSLEHWNYERTIYGSPAYLESDNAEWEKNRLVEIDF